MRDDEILKRFEERDEDALAACDRQYRAYCRRAAMNILRDEKDAEECVNDALLAAWNSIPPKRPDDLKLYLGKLTRETAVSRWRGRRAKKRVPEELITPFEEMEEAVGRFSVEEAVEEAELSAAISVFLRRLSPARRNVFIRRYWYCDPVADIAARFGFGESRVKMMLKRTRDQLADELRKEGYMT